MLWMLGEDLVQAGRGSFAHAAETEAVPHGWVSGCMSQDICCAYIHQCSSISVVTLLS